MKKKILGVLICGILVLGMTGCGTNDSETIARVKNQTNDRIYADYTLDSVLKKGLKNISYTEEVDESGIYTDVTISGSDKKTGEKVEILYRVRDNSVAFQSYKIDGDSQGAIAYEKYLKSLVE